MVNVETLVTRAGEGPRTSPGFSSSPFEPQLPAPTRVQDVNLVDPELYQYGDPHAAWKLLREEAPVFWNKQGMPGTYGRGWWAVTRYHDTNRVLRDHATFSNSESDFLDVLADQVGTDALVCLDPPRHRQLRKLTQPLFGAKLMESWEGAIRTIVTRLIDDVIEKGTCDFASDIAVKLPIPATCELLGVPASQMAEVQRVSEKLHATASPEALMEFTEVGMGLFGKLLSESRGDLNNGLVTAILGGEEDGAPLSDEVILSYLWILFVGGLDSTAHAATGSMLTMFHHPDQMELLRREPELMDSAVEEMLRWTSISQHLKRVALADAEIAGVQIKKGDFVAIFQPSANRDAEVFPDPFRFDIRRKFEQPTMTFGMGAHTCLGLHFARLELRVLFQEVLARMPDIAQAGPVERGRGFTILLSPIHKMPVSFTPGPVVGR